MFDTRELDHNITTSSYFATSRFHDDFTRLRHEDPVHWTQGNAVKPFWSITRYDDCVKVLDDPHRFSSAYGGIMPLTATEPTPEERLALGFDALPTFLDPPVHLGRRQPFNKHFAAPAMGRMRSRIQSVIDDLVGAVLPRGECDIVADLVGPLPALLVCEMMGVPRDDWDRIRYYCEAFMGAQDPKFQIDGDKLKTQRAMLQSLFNYMLELAMKRRIAPADDFSSVIANMTYANGEQLDERDVGWWSFSLVVAGLETTRGALSAGLLGLMQQPEQAARLRADPALAPSAAEEIVRWVCPSKQKFRIATRDVELRGKLIREGDWVVPWLVSANWDETVFANPGKIDVGRNPNPHIGFGSGPHSCLGRHLARLEMQLMLLAVMQLMPDMEVTGGYSWLQSDNSSGLTTLPVRFSPRRVLAPA